MEIYPALQFQLLAAAFFLGACFGLIWELFAAIRILLGAYRPPERYLALYRRPLPLLCCGVPISGKRARRLWRLAVVFVTDLFYCVLFSLSLVLLLYEYNDGAWRLSVPLLALLGLAVFRVTLSRLLSGLSALAAYALAVLLAYCRALARLLVRTLLRLLQRGVCRPIRAVYLRLRLMLWQRRSRSLCHLQLQLAEAGLTHFIKKEKRDVKTKKKQSAPAVGDRHSDPRHLCGGAFHFCQSTDGVEPAAKRKRRA